MVAKRKDSLEYVSGIPYEVPVQAALDCIETFPVTSQEDSIALLFRSSDSQLWRAQIDGGEQARIDWLALNLQANMSGVVSPFFRKHPYEVPVDLDPTSNGPGTCRSRGLDEIQLFRDLLLIDVHWVVARRLQTLKQRHFRGMFVSFAKAGFQLADYDGEPNWNGL